MSSLGERLKEAREKTRLTQIQAAKKLGISNGTLSGYERNYRDPDTHILRKLAILYDQSVDWLTGHDFIAEEKQAYDIKKAGDPGSAKRTEFTKMFMEELVKLPEDVQKDLYNLVKNMPK